MENMNINDNPYNIKKERNNYYISLNSKFIKIVKKEMPVNKKKAKSKNNLILPNLSSKSSSESNNNSPMILPNKKGFRVNTVNISNTNKAKKMKLKANDKYFNNSISDRPSRLSSSFQKINDYINNNNDINNNYYYCCNNRDSRNLQNDNGNAFTQNILNTHNIIHSNNNINEPNFRINCRTLTHQNKNNNKDNHFNKNNKNKDNHFNNNNNNINKNENNIHNIYHKKIIENFSFGKKKGGVFKLIKKNSIKFKEDTNNNINPTIDNANYFKTINANNNEHDYKIKGKSVLKLKNCNRELINSNIQSSSNVSLTKSLNNSSEENSSSSPRINQKKTIHALIEKKNVGKNLKNENNNIYDESKGEKDEKTSIENCEKKIDNNYEKLKFKGVNSPINDGIVDTKKTGKFGTLFDKGKEIDNYKNEKENLSKNNSTNKNEEISKKSHKNNENKEINNNNINDSYDIKNEMKNNNKKQSIKVNNPEKKNDKIFNSMEKESEKDDDNDSYSSNSNYKNDIKNSSDNNSDSNDDIDDDNENEKNENVNSDNNENDNSDNNDNNDDNDNSDNNENDNNDNKNYNIMIEQQSDNIKQEIIEKNKDKIKFNLEIGEKDINKDHKNDNIKIEDNNTNQRNKNVKIKDNINNNKNSDKESNKNQSFNSSKFSIGDVKENNEEKNKTLMVNNTNNRLKIITSSISKIVGENNGNSSKHEHIQSNENILLLNEKNDKNNKNLKENNNKKKAYFSQIEIYNDDDNKKIIKNLSDSNEHEDMLGINGEKNFAENYRKHIRKKLDKKLIFYERTYLQQVNDKRFIDKKNAYTDSIIKLIKNDHIEKAKKKNNQFSLFFKRKSIEELFIKYKNYKFLEFVSNEFVDKSCNKDGKSFKKMIEKIFKKTQFKQNEKLTISIPYINYHYYHNSFILREFLKYLKLAEDSFPMSCSLLSNFRQKSDIYNNKSRTFIFYNSSIEEPTLSKEDYNFIHAFVMKKVAIEVESFKTIIPQKNNKNEKQKLKKNKFLYNLFQEKEKKMQLQTEKKKFPLLEQLQTTLNRIKNDVDIEKKFEETNKKVINFNILSNQKLFVCSQESLLKRKKSKKLKTYVRKSKKLIQTIRSINEISCKNVSLNDDYNSFTSTKNLDFNDYVQLIYKNETKYFIDLFNKMPNPVEMLRKKDSNENTLLIYAVKNNNQNIVQFLLEKGANPDDINSYGNSSLHFAFSNKNYKIVNLLIKYNASEKLKNFHGLAPWECLGNFCE